MGFEDMLEPIKDMIEDGVKKIIPKDIEEAKWDTSDEANAKSFEKDSEDPKKEEQRHVDEGSEKEDGERIL